MPFLPSFKPLSSLVLGLSLLGAFGAGASGCGFSSGDDYRVTVTWLINGGAPTRASCRANGVDQVRFTVRGAGKDRVLKADCEEQVRLEDDGFYYGGFVSTRSFHYDEVYDYDVEMLDSAGRVIPDAGYSDSFEVRYGDSEPWVLTPLELWAPFGNVAAVSALWDIGGDAPTADSCGRLGATEIVIEVTSSGDPDFSLYSEYDEVARAPCIDGELLTDRAVLAEGEYTFRYIAIDAQGRELATRVAQNAYIVDRTGTLDIEPVNFSLR